MKQLYTIVLSFIFFTLFSCNTLEDKNKELKLTDFKFQSILGTTPTEPKSTYCLLGTGFFRTPRSDNSDKLITEWMDNHPNASVIPVSSIGAVSLNGPDSKMVYCWLIDKKDTLNNYLIRSGCFPGGTMRRPRTWDEMEKKEQEFYNKIGEKVDIKVYVEKKEYDKFIEQIRSAESYARDNHIGVWEEKTEK